MYSKIMIWANVTKFGQNFIAPQNFLGWYGYGNTASCHAVAAGARKMTSYENQNKKK